MERSGWGEVRWGGRGHETLPERKGPRCGESLGSLAISRGWGAEPHQGAGRPFVRVASPCALPWSPPFSRSCPPCVQGSAAASSPPPYPPPHPTPRPLPPSCLQVERGSLFPASCISLYLAYLTYSALQSEPHDYDCNTLGQRLSAASTSTQVGGAAAGVGGGGAGGAPVLGHLGLPPCPHPRGVGGGWWLWVAAAAPLVAACCQDISLCNPSTAPAPSLQCNTPPACPAASWPLPQIPIPPPFPVPHSRRWAWC